MYSYLIMKKYLLIIATLMLTATQFYSEAQGVKFITIKGRNIIGTDNKSFFNARHQPG